MRSWVGQADVDDEKTPGTTTADARRTADLEQENRELRWANEILKRAATFFGANSTALSTGTEFREPGRGVSVMSLFCRFW